MGLFLLFFHFLISLPLLESHGVMTTSQSVKVASLSGTYDSTVYEGDLEDENFDQSLLRNHYTKAQVDALIKSTEKTSIMDITKHGVDIFLSHEWPAGILERVQPNPAGAAPQDQEASTFSPVVSRAASQLQPRYHFAARSGQFWERAPYKNTNGAEHATRFIGLGEVGNKNKQRWFYAFNIVPLAKASDEVLAASINAMTTDSPLATLAEIRKRPRNEQVRRNGLNFLFDFFFLNFQSTYFFLLLFLLFLSRRERVSFGIRSVSGTNPLEDMSVVNAMCLDILSRTVPELELERLLLLVSLKDTCATNVISQVISSATVH